MPVEINYLANKHIFKQTRESFPCTMFLRVEGSDARCHLMPAELLLHFLWGHLNRQQEVQSRPGLDSAWLWLGTGTSATGACIAIIMIMIVTTKTSMERLLGTDYCVKGSVWISLVVIATLIIPGGR